MKCKYIMMDQKQCDPKIHKNNSIQFPIFKSNVEKKEQRINYSTYQPSLLTRQLSIGQKSNEYEHG